MNETLQTDCLVIGAGVIGLACAERLTANGLDVIVIEQEAAPGQGISSRNSEVIHAGIYYTPGSLKAELCIRGKELLYEFCQRYNVPHRQCGKLIVAGNDQEQTLLEGLFKNGEANGVLDLTLLDTPYIKNNYPQLNCSLAIHSPSTGIVSAHDYIQTLLYRLEDQNGLVACRTKVAAIEGNGPFKAHIQSDENYCIESRYVINAAGLYAVDVALCTDAIPRERIPKPVYAKGNYFKYTGKVPFQKLIYPMPTVGGLGIHLTLDMEGNARFGPDVEFLNENIRTFDYRVNETALAKFIDAIRRYWPALDPDKLHADYSGIRPKISRDGSVLKDFEILDGRQFSAPGLISLLGFESPGLTSSLAIAERVGHLIDELQ